MIEDPRTNCLEGRNEHIFNAPINVMPHLPQVGPGWGHIGVLHQLISKVLTLGATL